MKRYDLLTPEGTRDLLFDESVARRRVEVKLHKLFLSNGYSEVITPGIEFYDVFYLKKRYFSPENMYKLTDSKGRLIVIRPDSTMPIARLIGTRLRNETLPLKLYYSQNIFRVNPKDSGRDDEITQSGIEIVGGDIKRADFEAMALAVEVLKNIDAADFRFEIGDCGFFKELINSLSPTTESSYYSNEELFENIRYFVETKNYPELKKALLPFDNEEAKILAELPSLFGGREVFDKARAIFKSEKLLSLLDDLQAVYNNLSALGIGDMLSVDLGMVNKINYYTGILFKGYIEGYGMAVISGGRYDTLLQDFGEGFPAVGFAVNVNAAAQALLKKSDEPLVKCADVLVHVTGDNLSDGIAKANELIAQGLTVELSLFDELEAAQRYAAIKGIKWVEMVWEDNVID